MMTEIEILIVDITTVQVDAIVNAANAALRGGGGVDGAIHRAAGPGLLRACAALAGCPVGAARITGGYQLPAKFVIHTVGPVWQGGDAAEHQLLADCYENSLRLAVANGCTSIAFPAISCGTYGFPIAEAAVVAMRKTVDFLTREATSLNQVIFSCSSTTVKSSLADALNRLS
jgi:O-acetyl-ADP-ribose deacetylase (regulator of RNase III)